LYAKFYGLHFFVHPSNWTFFPLNPLTPIRDRSPNGDRKSRLTFECSPLLFSQILKIVRSISFLISNGFCFELFLRNSGIVVNLLE
jgi:hypothetical protein